MQALQLRRERGMLITTKARDAAAAPATAMPVRAGLPMARDTLTLASVSSSSGPDTLAHPPAKGDGLALVEYSDSGSEGDDGLPSQ